jgi:predicted GNAT superfamily acetyltransferase
MPTDRLIVRWDLNAARVRELVSDGDPPRTVPTPAAPRINDVKWQAGWPVSSEPRMDLDQPELILEIPPEWDVLCQAAPRMAADWQSKVGRALQGYLGRGYVAADFAPTEEGGRRRPLYLLRKA